MNPTTLEPTQQDKNRILDRDTALLFARSIDQADEPRREAMLSELAKYRDAEFQRIRQEKNQSLERVYLNFDAWWKETDDGRVYDDESRAAVANRKFVAAQFGHTVEDSKHSYPLLRDRFAKEAFGKPVESEREFFGLVRDRFAEERRKRRGPEIQIDFQGTGLRKEFVEISPEPPRLGASGEVVQEIRVRDSSQVGLPVEVRDVVIARSSPEGWLEVDDPRNLSAVRLVSEGRPVYVRNDPERTRLEAIIQAEEEIAASKLDLSAGNFLRSFSGLFGMAQLRDALGGLTEAKQALIDYEASYQPPSRSTGQGGDLVSFALEKAAAVKSEAERIEDAVSRKEMTREEANQKYQSADPGQRDLAEMLEKVRLIHFSGGDVSDQDLARVYLAAGIEPKQVPSFEEIFPKTRQGDDMEARIAWRRRNEDRAHALKRWMDTYGDSPFFNPLEAAEEMTKLGISQWLFESYRERARSSRAFQAAKRGADYSGLSEEDALDRFVTTDPGIGWDRSVNIAGAAVKAAVVDSIAGLVGAAGVTGGFIPGVEDENLMIRMAESIQAWGDRFFANPVTEGLPEEFAAGFGSIVSFYGAGLAVNALKLGGVARFSTLGTIAGAQSQYGIYSDLESRGVSPEDARLASLAGYVAGPVQILQVTRWMHQLQRGVEPGVKRALLLALEGAVNEFAAESSGAMIEEGAIKWTYRQFWHELPAEQRANFDHPDEINQEIMKRGAIGGVAGGFMGLFTYVIGRRSVAVRSRARNENVAPEQKPDVELSAQNAKIIERINAVVGTDAASAEELGLMTTPELLSEAERRGVDVSRSENGPPVGRVEMIDRILEAEDAAVNEYFQNINDPLIGADVPGSVESRGRQLARKFLVSSPLSGQMDEQTRQTYQARFSSWLEQGRTFAERLGAELRTLPENETRFFFAEADRDGQIGVFIHPQAFDAFLSLAKNQGDAFSQLAQDAITEELIHAAELGVIRDDWMKLPEGKRGSFSEFVQQERSRLFHDIRNRRLDLPKDARAKLDRALVDTYRMYFEKDAGKVARTGDKVLEIVESSPVAGVNHIAFIAEFTRMLEQVRSTGGVTETGFLQLLERLKAWVARALIRLKEVVTSAQAGEFGELLQSRLDEIAKRMDGASISEAGSGEVGGVFRGGQESLSVFSPKGDRAQLREAALARIEKDPEFRRERVAVGRRMLEAMRARHGEAIARTGAGLEPVVSEAQQAQAEREAIRQGLEDRLTEIAEQEKRALEAAGPAIVEQFAHRIEQAKTEATRRALNREANARLAERRKGIRREFAQRRENARQEARADRIKLREQEGADRLRARLEEARANRMEMIHSLRELEAVLSILPPEVRGKVGGARKLATLTTEKARTKYLADRIHQVGKELETWLAGQYRAAILDLAERSRPQAGENRLQKSRIGAEAQRIADRVLAATLLDTDATSAELARLEAEIALPDTGPEKAADLFEQWSITNMFGDLASRESASLEPALKWFHEAVRTGREQWRMQEGQRVQENRRKAALIKRAIGRGTLRDLAIKARPEKFKDTLKAFALSHYSFAQILESMIGGEVAKEWSQRASRADAASTDFLIAAQNRFSEAMKGISGGGQMANIKVLKNLTKQTDGQVPHLEGRVVKPVRISIPLARRIVSGEVKGPRALSDQLIEGFDAESVVMTGDSLPPITGADIEAMRIELASLPKNSRRQYVTIESVIHPGKEEFLPITPMQAIQYILTWEQRDGRAKLEKWGISERSIEAMRAILGEEGTSLMLFLRSEYARLYDIVNPIYRRLFGMDMPRTELYAPSRYISPGKQADASPFGMTDMTGSTPAFAKARVKHGSRPDQQADAMTVYWQHMAQVGHFIHYAELNREIAAVLLNPDVDAALQARFGGAVKNVLDSWRETLANMGNTAAMEITVNSRIMSAIIGAQSVKALGFNLRTIALQTDAGIRAPLAISAGEFAVQMGRLGNGQLFKDIQRAWHSDAIQRRIVAGSRPEIRWVFDKMRTAPGYLHLLASYSMLPMQYADAWWTSVSAAMVYDANFRRAKKANMNDTAAENAALGAMEDMVSRYAQPVERTAKSLQEVRGGAFQRLFMLFMSDMRLKTAVYARAVEVLATGKGDKMQAARHLIMIHFLGLVNQFIINMVRDGFTDDSDDEIWTAESFAYGFLAAPVSGFYLAGNAMDIAIRRATGQSLWASSNNPLVNSMADAWWVGSNLDELISGDPEAMLRAWRRTANAMAVWGPASAAPAATLNIARFAMGAAKNLESED